MYQEILYEVDDPVALITLNRPESLNGWNQTFDDEVADALRRAQEDPSVFGIIITGAGRAFSAGADMKLLEGLTSGEGDAGGLLGGIGSDTDRSLLPDGDFNGRFPYMMMIDKPIIAAINGPVAGMSYAFALCCDIRVASPDAMFVTAFSQRGLIAEWGLSWLLSSLVGPSVALDLLFTSRKVMGEEAVRLGLANYLTPADELVSFCREYIERLAATTSPTSLAIMKRQVYQQVHRGLGLAEYDSQRLMMDSFHRPDFEEGVTSFIEKRPPVFKRLGSDND
ncbi:MAG TPA: enoyl-CoA hydratase-related protein [Ilumatobacter sp.]|nr:enoyl-CoA hydratase-related protein [Ilumatobacter sp.]